MMLPNPEIVQQLPNDLGKLRRFFSRWTQRGEVRACYEASGAGYVLHREITAWGVHCDVIAPSLIPTRPGQRRKFDRYDATQLGRLYRVGELTPIRIPSPAEERVRDLVRCRQCFQREILRSRHYILKFLRRRDFIFREACHWGQVHRKWLQRLLKPGSLAPEDRAVFAEYLALLDYKISRRDDLDEQIEKIAFSSLYRPFVQRLTCFRGISTLAAMTLVTEIGDWRRFERPSQLMAFLGLVPSEDSSEIAFVRAPSPRPATVAVATSSSRLPGNIDIGLPSRLNSRNASWANHPTSSLMPGRLNTVSSSSSTASTPRNHPRSPPSPPPVSSSAFSGLSCRISRSKTRPNVRSAA